MTTFAKKREAEIFEVVTDLVNYLRKKARLNHAGNCLTISQFVRFHLMMVFGMETEITAVWVKTQSGLVLHYLVQMRNGRIIDATASQFEGMPLVYIGERPKNYFPTVKTSDK